MTPRLLLYEIEEDDEENEDDDYFDRTGLPRMPGVPRVSQKSLQITYPTITPISTRRPRVHVPEKVESNSMDVSPIATSTQSSASGKIDFIIQSIIDGVKEDFVYTILPSSPVMMLIQEWSRERKIQLNDPKTKIYYELSNGSQIILDANITAEAIPFDEKRRARIVYFKRN
jgi:hypothetical protein